MEPLETHLDTAGDDFRRNAENLTSLVEDLKTRLAAARQGGGAKYGLGLSVAYNAPIDPPRFGVFRM
jgi:hypothetical protein